MIRNFGRPLPAGVIYPDAIYSVRNRGKTVSLTFDDGPDPDSTPRILDTLAARGVKASFFCTGSRVQAYPGLFARIVTEGHTVGNHGFSHLNGLTTAIRPYCADIFRGRDITCSNLFRPPYGRLRVRQYRILEKSMQIVFWNLMPYDFDASLSAERSYRILVSRVKPGSLIVLHDKPESSLHSYLDSFLTNAVERGYQFVSPDEYLRRE